MPGVFVATLPGAPAHGAFDQLLANSKRQIRARYPNGDPEGVSGLCFTKGQCTDDQSLCTQGKGQWPAAGEGCTGFALGDSTEHVFLGPDQTYGGHMVSPHTRITVFHMHSALDACRAFSLARACTCTLRVY